MFDLRYTYFLYSTKEHSSLSPLCSYIVRVSGLLVIPGGKITRIFSTEYPVVKAMHQRWNDNATPEFVTTVQEPCSWVVAGYEWLS